MNRKEIHFVIDREGNIQSPVNGIKGTACGTIAEAIEKLGRVVMLGPPNKGSQAADKLKNFFGYRLLNGPAGAQLGTDQKSPPMALGSANFEVGIIAGTRSINWLLSSMLPGPNDGKVTVENTKLEGMADHLTLPVTHPLMMRNKRVIESIIVFLQQGSFIKAE